MTGHLGSTTTAFSRLSTRAARGTLVATLLAALAGAAWAPAPPLDGASARPNGERPGGRGGDGALHQATLARTAHGENYYDAVDKELRARRYPTRSLFNWRTPLPVWAIAQLPSPAWGRAILAAIGIGVVVLGFGLLAAEGGLASAAWGAFLLLDRKSTRLNS